MGCRREHGLLHHAAGLEANRFNPSRSERNFVASWPLMLFPASSNKGEKVPMPALPGAMVTMPPLTPLLPGSPTSYNQSPDCSYMPAVASTASTRLHLSASTTRSLVMGFTPPSARVA